MLQRGLSFHCTRQAYVNWDSPPLRNSGRWSRILLHYFEGLEVSLNFFVWPVSSVNCTCRIQTKSWPQLHRDGKAQFFESLIFFAHKDQRNRKSERNKVCEIFGSCSGRQMLAGLGLLSAVALGSKFLDLFLMVFTKNNCYIKTTNMQVLSNHSSLHVNYHSCFFNIMSM